MVVMCSCKFTGKMAESRSLKFGMDRILSEDMSSKRPSQGQCWSNLQPPCAGCLSSIYRCCRSSNLSDAAPHLHQKEIHVAEPLKLYNDSLIPTEVSRNRQIASEPISNSVNDVVRRKRSWSRAVFSNLQRKGLEKRFQIQKYITKPDRRQLAATLGLTDAQVKVWFQNRRMKWRHSKELLGQNAVHQQESSQQNVLTGTDSSNSQITESECESDVDVQTVNN